MSSGRLCAPEPELVRASSLNVAGQMMFAKDPMDSSKRITEPALNGEFGNAIAGKNARVGSQVLRVKLNIRSKQTIGLVS